MDQQPSVKVLSHKTLHRQIACGHVVVSQIKELSIKVLNPQLNLESSMKMLVRRCSLIFRAGIK